MRRLVPLLLLTLPAFAAAQTINPPTTTYRLAWNANAAGDAATRYEYRLRATDPWVANGLTLAAPLPALPDGAYAIGVRACRTGAVPECSAPASLAVTVQTPVVIPPTPGVPTGLRVEPVITTPVDPPVGVVRMDCRSGAAWPLCGAGRTVGNDAVGTCAAAGQPVTARWERTYVAAEDAVEIHMCPGATGEGYYGWQWAGLPAPAAGATRVLRARIKVMSPITWGSWGDKFMVLGDVSNDAANRIIATMEMYQGQPHLNVDKNIDGRYAFGFLTPDAYTAVQIVIAPVSPGSTTYASTFYVNGVAQPVSPTYTINPAQWRDFNVGYYGQYANGGHVRLRFKDVEFGSTFDPNFR